MSLMLFQHRFMDGSTQELNVWRSSYNSDLWEVMLGTYVAHVYFALHHAAHTCPAKWTVSISNESAYLQCPKSSMTCRRVIHNRPGMRLRAWNWSIQACPYLDAQSRHICRSTSQKCILTRRRSQAHLSEDDSSPYWQRILFSAEAQSPCQGRAYAHPQMPPLQVYGSSTPASSPASRMYESCSKQWPQKCEDASPTIRLSDGQAMGDKEANVPLIWQIPHESSRQPHQSQDALCSLEISFSGMKDWDVLSTFFQEWCKRRVAGLSKYWI